MLSLAQLIQQPLAATALIADDGQQQIHGQQFEQALAGLNGQLQQQPCRRWLLSCQQPLSFAVALLACWRAGHGVVIPVNHQPETLAASRAELGLMADGPLPLVPNWQAGSASNAGPALQLWTSGSSGAPKAVTKRLDQLDAELQQLELCFGPRLGQRPLLATVPPHHIYGLLFRLLWPLAAGRLLLGATLAYPEQLAWWLERQPAAVLISSPSFIQLLLASHEHRQLPPLACCFSSGGPLAASAATAALAAWGEAPIEVYGSTETGGIAWRQQHHGPRWTPFAPIHWRRDPTEGTLAIRSPYLADDQWWPTADRIAVDGDGFVLLGRADRIVKIAEKRLSLDQLEQQLASHPWVADCALLLIEGGRTALAAAVVLSAAGEAALAAMGKAAVNQQLRQHLLARFEAVTLPRRWRYLPALPRTSQGKLPLARLQELFACKA